MCGVRVGGCRLSGEYGFSHLLHRGRLSANLSTGSGGILPVVAEFCFFLASCSLRANSSIHRLRGARITLAGLGIALDDGGFRVVDDGFSEGEAGHGDHFDIGERQGDADDGYGLCSCCEQVADGKPKPRDEEPDEVQECRTYSCSGLFNDTFSEGP